MKTTSCLQRTFFRRPAVRALVPDLKLLLTVMHVSCESHVGVWIPAGLGEDTGLSTEALDGGIKDLERRGLIMTDGETGEVFLCGFFRDNTFKTGARAAQAAADFDKILSKKLSTAILEAVDKSPSCCLKKDDIVINQQVSL